MNALYDHGRLFNFWIIQSENKPNSVEGQLVVDPKSRQLPTVSSVGGPDGSKWTATLTNDDEVAASLWKKECMSFFVDSSK